MVGASHGLARTPALLVDLMRGWAKGLRVGLCKSCAALALALAGIAALPVAAETIAARDVYVIDGDTIDVGLDRFRLVGLDTPETYRARCDYELALGQAATARLRELIASGQLLDLVVLPGRDRYGRGLARLYVGRRDIADVLISEGLARPYEGGRRQEWC
jgi:endonuclease YncB( thermonuclease family)